MKQGDQVDMKCHLARSSLWASYWRPLSKLPPWRLTFVCFILYFGRRRIKSDVKSSSSNTVAQLTELKRRRATLQRQILRFRAIQPVYMGSITTLLSNVPESSTMEPEDTPLILPSTLQPIKRKVCTFAVDAIEEKFRESQCRDALCRLRTCLHTKTHFEKYRNANVRGQRSNTRAHALVGRLSNKINSAADKYRLAREALLSLRGCGPWEDELRVLRAQDIVAASHVDEPMGLGEGRRTTSWIWKTTGSIGDNECINDGTCTCVFVLPASLTMV